MGGRVVEGAGLENRKARERLGGSNPSPSATLDHKWVVSSFFRTFDQATTAPWGFFGRVQPVHVYVSSR